jgi:hypothetical protein
MKKGLFALGLMGLLGVFGVGCGNVCDDAADICAEAASVSSDAEGGECTGAAECLAQCIVDADSCDPTDEGLVECFGGCNG